MQFAGRRSVRMLLATVVPVLVVEGQQLAVFVDMFAVVADNVLVVDVKILAHQGHWQPSGPRK